MPTYMLKELLQSDKQQPQVQSQIMLIKSKILEKVIFKNCAPFTKFISKINSTQVNYFHDIDVVMRVYNLKEYGCRRTTLRRY